MFFYLLIYLILGYSRTTSCTNCSLRKKKQQLSKCQFIFYFLASAAEKLTIFTFFTNELNETKQVFSLNLK